MSSKAYLRLLGAAVLIFLLAPLAASHDDDIRIVAFVFDSETYDDAVGLGPHVSSGNHDVAGTHALSQFHDVELPPMFALEIASASRFFATTSEDILSNQPPTARIGRAPPAV